MGDDERCGRSKEVNTPELIGHWGFKEVQEEILLGEASTLQIKITSKGTRVSCVYYQ